MGVRMLSEATRRALAACLYDAGFTGVARLIAENTSDVFELVADQDDPHDPVIAAIRACTSTGRAQLVLVVPDGEGEWLKPELVGVIAGTLRAPDGEPVFRGGGGSSEPLSEEEMVSGAASALRGPTPDPFAVRNLDDYPPVSS